MKIQHGAQGKAFLCTGEHRPRGKALVEFESGNAAKMTRENPEDPGASNLPLSGKGH